MTTDSGALEMASAHVALLLLCLLGSAAGQGIGGTLVKLWPLADAMPVEPDIARDGSAAGPAGVVKAVVHSAGACHEEVCNCFTSQAPHVFRITWCASTAGLRDVGCSMDVGYRSPEGASHGRIGWSVAGLNASNASFTFLPEADVFRVPAESAFPLSTLGKNGKKNVIDTKYQALAPGGAGDDLPLTASSGFCCRAEFSGGKTVTGTIYVGDLEVRAGAAPPSATPSATPSTTSTSTSTSTATATATATATGSASASAAPPPAAAATEASVSVSAASGFSVGAALAGAAATLALQFLVQRLRGGAAASGGAGKLSAVSREGVGANASRERVALLGRVVTQ